MSTGAPAVESDREPDQETNRPPQLTQEVINQGNLPGLDELTATVLPPRHESWWRGFTQHMLAHVTGVAVIAGLAVAFDLMGRSSAEKAAPATDCSPTHLVANR